MPSTAPEQEREAKRAIEEARRLRKALEVAKGALEFYSTTHGKCIARDALEEIEKKETGHG